jgi:hypothetical protein
MHAIAFGCCGGNVTVLELCRLSIHRVSLICYLDRVSLTRVEFAQ